jgi:hypothetical protein
MTKARGAERKNLPDALRAVDEEIHESVSPRPQIADAASSRQGGRMQEYSARSS